MTGLRWWPLALVAVAVLVLAVTLAWRWPTDPARRRLLPVAHLDRLTALPEYVRLARRHAVASAVTLALLVVTLGAAVLVAARPVSSAASAGEGAATPRDVMLCVGQPVTDPSTAVVLDHLARRLTEPAGSTGPSGGARGDRVGITSPTRRVVPLTADLPYVAGRLGEYSRAATADPVAAARAAADFAPSPGYLDYRPDVADVLALCLTGLPPADGDRRRLLVYLGEATLRPAGDTAPTLFDLAAVTDRARADGVEMSILTRPAATQAADDALAAVVDATGGRRFADVGTGVGPDVGATTTDPAALRAHLDDVFDAGPAPGTDPALRAAGRSSDAPAVAAVTALVAALLWALSRALSSGGPGGRPGTRRPR